MTSDDIDQAFDVMKHQFPGVEGLQSTILGPCILGKGVPKYHPISENGKFVQILHVPNHWICATNMFSDDSHKIYVYDSSHSSLMHKDATVQLTSLMRRNDNPDKFEIHLRNCARQRPRSQECGYYALANAIAIASGSDPTLWRYDVGLVEAIINSLTTGDYSQVPVKSIVHEGEDLKVYKQAKLHCLCQQRSSGDMVQCSCCNTWFHCSCVGVVIEKLNSQEWLGPCCS